MFLVQFSSRNIEGKEVTRMVLTFLPLFLFGALRVNCGDYEIYENYNGWVRSSGGNIYDVIERMEPGYAYLNKLLPYRWLIIVTSFFSCYAYGVLFVKLIPKQYRWFGIIVFFLVADKTFYFMFSSIRNSISIAILMIYVAYRVNNYGKERNRRKEIIKLVLATFVAYSFHASALIFFPIAFVATIDRKIGDIELYVWTALLIALWIIPVNQMIDNLFLFQTDYFSRYDDYIEVSQNAGTLARVGATIFAVLCLVFIHLSEKNDNMQYLFRLALIFAYSYMLGSLNIRISQYFMPFMICFIASVYMRKKESIWATSLLVFAIAFLFYSSFIAGTFGSIDQSPFVKYQISLFQ